MTPDLTLLRSRYDRLHAEGAEQVDAGDLERALRLFDEALELARSSGDQDLADRAYCSRAAVAIELEGGTESITPLRDILVRDCSLETRWLANYQIARAYELRREFKKAMFYARAARETADLLERAPWQASSLNLLGNTLLAESHVDQALEAYLGALAQLPGEGQIRQARYLDNVGYCMALKGRAREGLALLLRSLRILRRRGARRYMISTRLDLGFAYLEVGDTRSALRHSRAACELAEEFGEPGAERDALYLMGEAARLAGDLTAARAYFDRLQRGHYPADGFLTDFLLAVGVRKMINLRA